MAKDDFVPYLLQLVSNALSSPIIEREIAFIVDLFVVAALTFIPIIGLPLAILYFLVKDILPFSGNTSFGKSVYHIRVVNAQDNAPLSKQFMFKAVVRNVIILIPILNIVDGFYLISTGKRLADIWVETDVVSYEESL